MEADTEQRKKFEIARAPPARIQDAVGGIFDATLKELKTIYGMLKRVQVVAMVLEREYTPASQGTGGEKGTKSRLRLTLDDGTGMMAATWFGVGEEEASAYEKGDMVIALVRAGEYKNEITFTVDGIRKLTDLSVELHHRATILKKLKQLVSINQPLEIQGGGRITNPADDASKFFTSKEKGNKQQDISEIEQPVTIGDASTQKIQFTSRLGEEAGEGGAESEAGGSGKEVGSANAGEGLNALEALEGPERRQGDIEIDDDIIKGSIMETIMQPEFIDGITIAQLAQSLAIDRENISRILKIMANEGNVEEIPTKPGIYRGK
nr:hypothetical protein [Candidatus Sigynarchaeum springense]